MIDLYYDYGCDEIFYHAINEIEDVLNKLNYDYLNINESLMEIQRIIKELNQDRYNERQA